MGRAIQIVLNTPKSKNINNRLLNLQDNNDDLATEILEEKSLSLIAYFEFARTSSNKNDGNYSNFIKWKKKLDIDLKKTFVLNIAYRDKNKNNPNT